MKFVFVRHSNSQVDPTRAIAQWGLSDVGVERAKHLAHDPEILSLNLLYSSLQVKAVETMVYLSKPHGIPVRTDDRLGEVSSFTTRFFEPAEHERILHDFYMRKISRIEGGETIDEALARFEDCLQDIAAECPDGRVGVVTHGSVLTFFSEKFGLGEAFSIHLKLEQPDVAIFDWSTKTFDKPWRNL